jgi:transposase-like protein
MSLDQLMAKVSAAPLNAQGRRKYTTELKREIMAALCESGLSHEGFAGKIGVPSNNLSNWRKFAPKLKTKRPAKFRAIAVEPEVKRESLTIKTAGGLVIEGLSISATAELLSALSARSTC